MMQYLEAGETLAGLGRIYGVSRDRIRTQMRRFGLSKPEPLSGFTSDQVQQWVDQIIAGDTMLKTAERVGMTTHMLRDYIRKYGHDLEQVKLERSKHRYDGKTYSNWTVISGSHKTLNNNQVLDCRCVCGEIRTVSLTNLIGGATTSCGCIGYFSRQAYPWICETTGETVISTSELARLTGINDLSLHRSAHRTGSAVDAKGNVWVIQHDKGVTPGLARPDTIVWINHQTNQQLIGCKAVSEQTNGSINTIKWYGHRRKSYTAKDGSIWDPTTLNLIT